MMACAAAARLTADDVIDEEFFVAERERKPSWKSGMKQVQMKRRGIRRKTKKRKKKGKKRRERSERIRAKRVLKATNCQNSAADTFVR